MWRVLNVVEQMSRSLTEAAGYLEEALRAMDDETTVLQARLHSDARTLRSGIAGADLSETDRATLLTALDRVEATAASVAAFAHRRSDHHASAGPAA